MASLDMVYEFDIELVLAGHRDVIRNCKERIQELKGHHQKRLDEMISISEKGSQNAFQVASQMSWEIIYDASDLFPITQKWVAIGGAISHLKYLEEKGAVETEIRRRKRMFSLNLNHII